MSDPRDVKVPSDDWEQIREVWSGDNTEDPEGDYLGEVRLKGGRWYAFKAVPEHDEPKGSDPDLEAAISLVTA